MVGKERLVELLAILAVGEGFSPSLLDAVQFLRASQLVSRHPVVYEPGIVIIGQGRKRGYLGGKCIGMMPITISCYRCRCPLSVKQWKPAPKSRSWEW